MITFEPIPIFLGDTFGSTISVMLFPEDISKARAWHARHLAQGALQSYLDDGNCFEDRLAAYCVHGRSRDQKPSARVTAILQLGNLGLGRNWLKKWKERAGSLCSYHFVKVYNRLCRP